MTYSDDDALMHVVPKEINTHDCILLKVLVDLQVDHDIVLRKYNSHLLDISIIYQIY